MGEDRKRRNTALAQAKGARRDVWQVLIGDGHHYQHTCLFEFKNRLDVAQFVQAPAHALALHDATTIEVARMSLTEIVIPARA